jgi:CheY-like chemotaxis protein
VELAAAVQSAVEATRPLIEASALELTVTLPRESIFLDADPTRLAQIISNLLNNAAKYTERGGRIWVSAQRQSGSVAISIRDTGIGLAKEHLSQIFKMFSQVTPALERSQGGLGIGLALVRGLTELHQGTIEAHSNGPGLGSEFIVRLPVLEVRDLGPAVAASSEARPTLGSKCRILVVEDNIDSAQSLALLLRRMGYEIEVAYDGLEAVQATAAFRPRVVLLDIGLPRMNGYEAAKRIREQSGSDEVAIVALTGWGQEKDKQLASEAGFDHHLTKPVEPATLTNLLAAIAATSQRSD